MKRLNQMVDHRPFLDHLLRLRFTRRMVLFHAHLQKGKAGRPNEFGKMNKLQEAENHIVIDYEVYDRRPHDSNLLIAAIDKGFGSELIHTVRGAGYCLRVSSAAGYENLIDHSIRDMDAMLETFAAMLRIAEVEAIMQKAGFADVDLSDLLQTVLEVYEPLADEKSQVLSSRIAPKLFVQDDRELLTQLFANLVQNAIRHTPRGTRITVETTESSDVIEVVVADTGPGIPEDERGKVFGDSLVAAIAALHGIEIVLGDNSPGLQVRLRFAKCQKACLAAGAG